jgi:uncharacterized protein
MPSQKCNMLPTIQCASGKYFDFLNPAGSHICIEDIAHALSHINRFTGHTRVPYSVAQHSYVVSCIVPYKDALAALLHDAAEAYLGDVSSPLKQLLPEYKVIERRVHAAIFERFGLDPELPASVKEADLIALSTERRDLMPNTDPHDAWDVLTEVRPLQPRIIVCDANNARNLFLQRYRELTN